MKLDKLIDLVDNGYGNERLVKAYHDKPAEDHGDTLARFIALEIAESFDANADDEEQLQGAVSAIETAEEQINNILNRLYDEIDRIHCQAKNESDE
jgi:hypothetical protein